MSKVLYRDVKHPEARATFEQEKHPAQSNKAPRSDEKSTLLSEEKHPTSTPEMQCTERSSESSYEKPPAFRGGGVSETATATAKAAPTRATTRVCRRLSGSGHNKQTINRVVELLHEDVRNPEAWADKAAVKVAEEVDAMNARVYRSYRSSAAERVERAPVVPPDKRNWRAALPDPKQSKPKDEGQ